ncbi:hypothetical protein CC1G_01352 [Coprinopsis cinerea okayama7|uniref:Uncharacterized protein n=1 Tax=Coprinopsis cinerea (strain Okayama-7 / 130 / ATCC MYA-4618 / FGSC 9003) TaxID=240176 RepID=A8NYJ0_COPC7|nr:hypothetical protein CC1G_01352 [Coprinopsis cinerea okayama7\|eukprot:XP_001837440.2 hypothetical protein CC1G_01352 [Coprinopsis cinerea okayama7\
MGQRHQAFLIAKVIPKKGDTIAKYRCVAAVHNQWCYGKLPLVYAHQFYVLAKKHEATILLREELAKYAENNAVDSDIPCPYATKLLEQAFTEARSVTGDMVSLNQAFALDVSKGTYYYDNDDGITVIDVTDPQNLSLCFLQFDETKPLTPELYLRGYYPIKRMSDFPDAEKLNLETIANLDHIPLLPMTALAETWPEEYEATADTLDSGPTGTDPVEKSIPSLFDLSLEKTLDYAIENDEIEALEHVLAFPRTSHLILEKLKTLEFISDKVVDFAAQIFAKQPSHPKEVNLAMFNLDGKQVLRVLLDKAEQVERLDVYGNARFDKDALETILTHLPNLRWVNIVQTAISNADIRELLNKWPFDVYRDAAHLHTVVHPFFIDTREDIPHSLGIQVDISSFPDDPNPTFSFPMFSIQSVASKITEVFKLLLPSDASSDQSFLRRWWRGHPSSNPMQIGPELTRLFCMNSFPGSEVSGGSWELPQGSELQQAPRNYESSRMAIQNQPALTFLPRRGGLPKSPTEGTYTFLLVNKFHGGRSLTDFWSYGVVTGRSTTPTGEGALTEASTDANAAKEWEVLDLPTFFKRLEQDEGLSPPTDPSSLEEVCNLVKDNPSRFGLLTSVPGA